jgi:hypothetical protein
VDSKRFPVSVRFLFNPLKVYENVVETVGVPPVVLVVLPAHYFDKGNNDGESAADNGNDYGVTHWASLIRAVRLIQRFRLLFRKPLANR